MSFELPEILKMSLIQGSLFVAVVVFILKLMRESYNERCRQANNCKVIDTYIHLAIEEWERSGVGGKNSEVHGIENLSEFISTTLSGGHEKCGGDEQFTPFVPFSPYDSLSISEMFDSLGFLDRNTFSTIMEFGQEEALIHALANDFRSDYVRKQFTQERKVELLKIYNDRVINAYTIGSNAREELDVYVNSHKIWWFIPFGLQIRKKCKQNSHT